MYANAHALFVLASAFMDLKGGYVTVMSRFEDYLRFLEMTEVLRTALKSQDGKGNGTPSRNIRRGSSSVSASRRMKSIHPQRRTHRFVGTSRITPATPSMYDHLPTW